MYREDVFNTPCLRCSNLQRHSPGVFKHGYWSCHFAPFSVRDLPPLDSTFWQDKAGCEHYEWTPVTVMPDDADDPRRGER